MTSNKNALLGSPFLAPKLHRADFGVKRTKFLCCATVAQSCLGRRALLTTVTLLSTAAATPIAHADEVNSLEPMEALKGKDYGKPRMRYPDYTMTPSGLQYQDFRIGEGEPAKEGDTAVVDWAGYTIGYYGRPFEARNKPKGSSFTGENKDYLRFVLGTHSVIPGFEEAVLGMKPGGIRRVVVPVELSYPDNWKQQGPLPTTFAGERALDFVLNNRGMIDKTLLFDIELIRLQ